jgi:ubiquinone/menaquinone biosynthesis C-methylase UbiE
MNSSDLVSFAQLLFVGKGDFLYNFPMKSSKTSWEKVNAWYDQTVGEEGHYFHRNIIFPNLLKAWDFSVESPTFLDLACGQGVLARQLPKHIPYVGIDISPSLIQSAKQYDKNKLHEYLVADITKPLKVKKNFFSHAAIILALQNLESPSLAIQNAAQALKEGGELTLVINHPYFRIPRQSSWGIDEAKKIQYRRQDRYMTPLKIPIQTHPGAPKESTNTFSYHWPLSELTHWLCKNGLFIKRIDEWCSDKKSTGARAKMEDFARDEFPLFMVIRAKKMFLELAS